MTEEEKRYKIEKISEYNQLLAEEDKNLRRKTFSTAISCIAVAMCCSNLSNSILFERLLYINLLGAIANIGFAVYNIRDMLEVISNKTGLKIDIRRLEEDLELGEIQNRSR